MYIDFNAGNKTYKLRLNTRNTVALEKMLGCNPLSIFRDDEEIPTITNMVNILYCSLLQLNHGISLNDAYDIFDEYIADGNTHSDFLMVIIDVFKISGLIPKETGNTEKN